MRRKRYWTFPDAFQIVFFQPLCFFETGPQRRHLERPFSLCEIFRDAIPHCSFSESESVTEINKSSDPCRADLNQDKASEFVPVSSSIITLLNCLFFYSWWITVALCSVVCERGDSRWKCEMFGTTCHGSAVKMEIFMLFDSHSLFSHTLPEYDYRINVFFCLFWNFLSFDVQNNRKKNHLTPSVHLWICYCMWKSCWDIFPLQCVHISVCVKLCDCLCLM